MPLLAIRGERRLRRAVCIAPDAHLDAAPPGLHRRFSPSLSLNRVLRESGLTYGLLLNAFELDWSASRARSLPRSRST